VVFFILAISNDGGTSWEDDFENRYESGAEAQEEAKSLNRWYGSRSLRRYRVRRVVETDSDNFIAREQAKGHKFIDMTELPDHAYCPYYRLPHINPDKPREIRFFRSAEDAAVGRYTSCSMTRFFSSYCELNHQEFDDFLVEIGYYEGTAQLRILRDADEIERAYVDGPTSCMNDPDEYPLPDPHPARMYASPDLGVAVLERDGDCIARAVVNVERKIFHRVYGHGKVLKEELKKRGFRQTGAWSAWRGSRLLKVYDEDYEAYICPYLDMSRTVSRSRCGNYLRIAGPMGSLSSQCCAGFTEPL
jgi:hypothetical protein